MTAYFVGVDNGGTSTKAVVFDDQGRDIAGASRKVPMILPQPGFTERDMEVLWKANCEAIAEAVKSSKVSPSDIRGVACTGHGKGLYLWGRDGKPAYNGIVSTDSRAWAYPEKVAGGRNRRRVFRRDLPEILACQPVSLLCWLKDHRPGVVETTALDLRGEGLHPLPAHAGRPSPRQPTIRARA